jgi:hypothetical protein
MNQHGFDGNQTPHGVDCGMHGVAGNGGAGRCAIDLRQAPIVPLAENFPTGESGAVPDAAAAQNQPSRKDAVR